MVLRHPLGDVNASLGCLVQLKVMIGGIDGNVNVQDTLLCAIHG